MGKPESEAQKQATSTRFKQGVAALVEISPVIAGPLLFLAGAFRLVSAALPQLEDRLTSLSKWLPLGVIEFSHLVGSVVGTLMLFVAYGVLRRLTVARWSAVVLSLLGAVFSWLHGASYAEAVYLTLLALLFVLTGAAYWRRSGQGALSLPVQWVLLSMLMVCIAGWIGLMAYSSIPYSDEIWWRFMLDGDVSRFMRAGALVTVTIIGLLIWAMFRPHAPIGYSAPDIAALHTWLDETEVAPPLTRLALTGDKREFVSQDGRARLFFAVRGGAWIAMGGPAGAPDAFSDLIWQFRVEADRHNAWAVLYSIDPDELAPALDNGFSVEKVGEAAIIDLTAFHLDGGSRSALRHILRKGEKAGLTFEVLDGLPDDAAFEALSEISDKWLNAHGGAEKSFSLGRFERDYLSRVPIALVREADKPVAFASLMADPVGRRLAIDLMRHADAPPQTMEWLFLQLAVWAKQEAWRELDLGMVPLAGLTSRRFSPLFMRFGALVFSHGEEFYGFEGLRQFKAKFKPDWRPLYMASPGGARAFSGLLKVALLTSGGWRAMLFGKPD